MAQISADTMPIMNRHAAYDTSGYGTKSLDRCDQKGSQTIIRRGHGLPLRMKPVQMFRPHVGSALRASHFANDGS